MVFFAVLFHHLPVVSEENNENLHSRQQIYVPQTSFELDISQIYYYYFTVIGCSPGGSRS
jgi:hypothetical protein